MSELSTAPSVEVTVSCNAWFDECPDAAAIAAGAAQAALLDSADASRFIVDVTLADDAEQRHLNHTTVRREAAEQQKPLTNHLRHLIVHGVLHLLGLDHEEAAEAAAMEAREIKILAGLGVPDPYRGIM